MKKPQYSRESTAVLSQKYRSTSVEVLKGFLELKSWKATLNRRFIYKYLENIQNYPYLCTTKLNEPMHILTKHTPIALSQPSSEVHGYRIVHIHWFSGFL